MDEAVLALRIARRLKPKQNDNFGIFTADTILDIYHQATNGIFAVLVGVVGLSLVVGGIVIMDTRGATTIIKAQVPMSEMLTYEQHLTSATGGRGSYHMEYSHYDEVPSHLQTKIIAAAKAERAGVEVEEV